MNLESKLMKLLKGNFDLTFETVNDINSWDGSLPHLDVMLMEDIDEYLFEMKPSELINKIYYGDNFNPNDSYWTYDSLANIVSYSEYDLEDLYESYLDDIVEAAIRLKDYITFNEEIESIFEAEEEKEEA